MTLGIFSPTEAATVAVLYSLFLGAVVYQELTMKTFFDLLKEVVASTARLMIVIASALLFGWVLIIADIPQQTAEFLVTISDKPWVVLLIINVVLLILGAIIENIILLLILVPMLVPAMTQMGVDPIHFGVIMVFNIMVGQLTPPMGLSLYVAQDITGMPFDRVCRAVIPFYIPIVIALLFVTYVSHCCAFCAEAFWLLEQVFHNIYFKQNVFSALTKRGKIGMTYGYMGKILRVNLSDRKSDIEALPEKIYEKYLGGVSLGAKLLLEEVQPGTNWFSPENRMILTTGPLSGTRVSGSGTFCALSKGPMTEMGGATQANGFLGAYLRFSGYDGLLIQGKASSPVYLYIHENGVEFKDASHLTGKGTSETQQAIKKEFGINQKLSVFAIGPAGENPCPLCSHCR